MSANARAFSVAALIGDSTTSAQEHSWHSCASSDSSNSSATGMEVELLGKELWNKFYSLGTEMIITKAGRYSPDLIHTNHLRLAVCFYCVHSFQLLFFIIDSQTDVPSSQNSPE